MSATKAWTALIENILDMGVEMEPRGIKTLELLNYTSIIPMSYPIVNVKERELDHVHMLAEAIWILRGDDRLTDPVLKKNFAKYTDDGVRMSGAYGPMVSSQFRYVCDTLQNDPQSRQAVMTLWRPNPRPSKDIPCTLSLQFLIRDTKLHCVANMRSSDAWLGWPYDVFVFSMIAWSVVLKLYPKSTDTLSQRGYVLELGNLYLNAGSQHLYDKNWKQAMTCQQSVYCGDIKSIYTHGLNNPDVLIERLECIRNDPSDDKLKVFEHMLCH